MCTRNALALALALSIGWTACSSGGSTDPIPPDAAVPMLIAAGMTGIDPVPATGASGTVASARLGISAVDGVYELTTPVGMPFSFDVLTRAEGNAGDVAVSVAHALDGAVEPTGGPETLAAVGLVVNATGLNRGDAWLEAFGDGFVRLTINGTIQREQVLVVKAQTRDGTVSRMVRISIGGVSLINQARAPHGDHPDVVSERALYSSDSWSFGMPTIATSGDRTSIVAYEGDRANWSDPRRYEMRLQYDAAADTVTGGGSAESSLDSGHWCDHELAALFNVLALAHVGDGSVTVRMSYDRGATFTQVHDIPAAGAATRLVQVAIAADYSLAVAYARSGAQGQGLQMVLVEGRPVAFNGSSPVEFEFDPPRVIHSTPRDAIPLLFGVAWSDGGDLAIGYAFSWVTRASEGRWVSTSEFRCAVRRFGSDFHDTVVDSDIVIGRDPSVAMVGTGPTLRVFYAYEASDGLRLSTSEDGGVSWSMPRFAGPVGANTPRIFARESGGATRVDLLYMIHTGVGTELLASRWLDVDSSVREDYRLTTARMVDSTTATEPLNPAFGQMPYGRRLTQVSWFGYDAVRDGDEIVVVLDEETFDAAFLCFGAPGASSVLVGGLPSAGTTSAFRPATPPPLAPGLTEPVPAVDPTHRHQLKLLRIR